MASDDVAGLDPVLLPATPRPGTTPEESRRNLEMWTRQVEQTFRMFERALGSVIPTLNTVKNTPATITSNGVSTAGEPGPKGDQGERGSTGPAGTASVHAARVAKSVAQSFSNSTNAALVWQTESYDTDAIFTVGTSPSQFVAPASGYYTFCAGVEWDLNTSGTRYLSLVHNVSGVFAQTAGPVDTTLGVSIQNVAGSIYMTAGQSVQAFARYLTPATLNMNVKATSNTFFSVVGL